MSSFLVIHGPNLNLLGQRDQNHYGALTLDEINQKIAAHAKQNNVSCEIKQFNSEDAIIDCLHAHSSIDGIVINPAAFTHTSVAIRDAIDAIKAPVLEVHLSNVYKREEFRHLSYIAPVSIGQISGLGWHGYVLALDYLIQHSSDN